MSSFMWGTDEKVPSFLQCRQKKSAVLPLGMRQDGGMFGDNSKDVWVRNL